ncbi:hypothetical protein Plim_1025 [Planctopirus limnophila DSM 3776]|uniref:Uncharacterized protein n=1 Tax=Planctopirus limnophila (strain ATCC 43296 / DSM 3776 / IFAM 1008 / Mu 290) TaxID=521674 RepID=D5STA0_PLAL2|nr:hypothetical protein Plim_1025 [Planctopirus limnophila DSM 3776]
MLANFSDQGADEDIRPLPPGRYQMWHQNAKTTPKIG